ncbi:Crp/Fnr family transcriptional regulator [Parasphingorhabdus sp. JC815]|uniref:Crp/Fnr family transcriptional regulator n=1 Tax=Parasphingorhabdus sp. JC815 TaxID=3232140 RepID=UPI003458E105
MKQDEKKLALHVLGEVGWLKGYSPALTERLVNEGRLTRLGVGEWAQSEGDNRMGLFIVIRGLLHSYCAAPGDKSVLIGLVGPGSVLGHATCYSGGPRMVTAVCVEPSLLLEISETALDEIANQSPEIWRAIASFAYTHTRAALRMAAEVISLRPRERIAARLVAMAESDRPDETSILKISQELLGEMMGLTRKTMNIHLSAFEKAGFLKVGYAQIEIYDPDGLKEIANR